MNLRFLFLLLIALKAFGVHGGEPSGKWNKCELKGNGMIALQDKSKIHLICYESKLGTKFGSSKLGRRFNVKKGNDWAADKCPRHDGFKRWHALWVIEEIDGQVKLKSSFSIKLNGEYFSITEDPKRLNLTKAAAIFAHFGEEYRRGQSLGAFMDDFGMSSGIIAMELISSSKQNCTKRCFQSDGNNDTKWFGTKHFEIRFKNILQKCWMEFANACPNQTELIMLTMSRRHGFENRKCIRQTWMNDSIPGEVIRFLIADAGEGEAADVQQKLEEEQEKHGDLVFLHGFVDIYAHIHLKWYGALEWQQSFCANAKWVMKVDDDALVHLRRLAYWTEKTFRPIVVQNPLVYFGNIFHLSRPHRDPDSKWYVSKDVYPKDMYPDFMQGTVYLTTPATINAILLYTRQIDAFYLDDVLYTGILAELANVTLSDQKKHFLWRFSFDEKQGECEDGVPTALSIWGAENLNVFEHQYGRMKSITCKTH